MLTHSYKWYKNPTYSYESNVFICTIISVLIR